MLVLGGVLVLAPSTLVRTSFVCLAFVVVKYISLYCLNSLY